MSPSRPRDAAGRLKPLYTDDEIRDARVRVAAGESLRAVARDLGMGEQGHANLGRRIRALDAREAREARQRVAEETERVLEGARAIASERSGEPVPEPLQARAQAQAREERRAEPELSNGDYIAQMLLRRAVDRGDLTLKEALDLRARGLRPVDQETIRPRAIYAPQRGLIMSNVQLLRHAIAGRV